ncbi:nucleolar protein 14-like [Saccostrea echinata]|uniref:nucleolar protein 14-like n=1 Tax=Saccostrea echinata TaxID=191078 RepID=UPI002A7EE945|nr:nucleolar protein 14-like [Saccostrea echinata]XP_061183438.1 nucleolar protein 14-like [Saccostrea echinata]
MAKRKKNVADKTRNKKKESQKKINPFEVKINRQKQKIMGRKISKHDRGMPGLSRSKGIQKRKATLLQEYNQRFKNNKFIDKRFGENDTSLSLEEKMMKRFAMERAREKTNKFSLNDDEDDLTHYGQSLSSIEKFEEPEASEDEEDSGRIDANMVATEHFGGFLSNSNYQDLGGQKQKSWKERMEEVIAKSKKEKFERQAEKEKTKELTEKLDAEWKDVMKLMSSNKRGQEEQFQKADDFDIAVRELKFEMKGKATDKLKSEEELAQEEKKRLDKLEADRLRRMKGISIEEEEEKKKVHFSADDLDDNFSLDAQPRFHAVYKDGKMLKDEEDDDDEKDSEINDDDKGEDSGEDDSDDLGNVEEDYSDDVGNVEEDEDGGSEEDEKDTEGEKEDEEKDDVAEESDDESDDDSYKDIESGEDDSDKETSTESKTKKSPLNLTEIKKIMDDARKELPYTFQAPKDYDELLSLLQDHSEKDQLTIVTRMRKCHHVSLAEDNRQKLETLFSCLVQYFADLAVQQPPQLRLMDSLVPHLYELSQGSPLAAAQVLVDQIAERQEEFQAICERKGGRGLYPALDTLMLLKLVAILFPTSDFRHAVTTPAIIFITQILAETSVKHERDVAVGLFLCSLALEYVSLSKRYVPECINFLHGMLFLASNKDPNKYASVIPPFRPVGKYNDLLLVTKKAKKTEIKMLKMTKVLTMEMEEEELRNDEFRLSVIKGCVALLSEFSSLYQELPAYKEIFIPVLDMLEKLPVNNYPSTLQVSVQDLQKAVKEITSKPRMQVSMPQRKPKPLKMFEPKIEEVFEDKKKKKAASKEENEMEKMKHKYRKELKGAMREIRKDTQFLARQQLNEQMEKDSERKRKVKEIYHMLSSQEGDFKASKRTKKNNNPF